jgi:hypothetical protein
MHVNERIKNSNGNTSEWVKMELHEIIGSLLAIVLQSNKNNIKGTVTISPNSSSGNELTKGEVETSRVYESPLSVDTSTKREFSLPIELFLPMNTSIKREVPLPPIPEFSKVKDQYFKYSVDELIVICALLDLSTKEKSKIDLVDLLFKSNITIEDIQNKIDKIKNYKFRINCYNSEYIKDLKCGCKLSWDHDLGRKIVIENTGCKIDHIFLNHCSHYYFTNNVLFNVANNSSFHSNGDDKIYQYCKICNEYSTAECYINVFYEDDQIKERSLDKIREVIMNEIKEKEQCLLKFTFKELQTICVLFSIFFNTSDRTKKELINKILRKDLSMNEIQDKINGSKIYKSIISCFGLERTTLENLHCYYTNESLFDIKSNHRIDIRYMIDNQHCKKCNIDCSAEGYINAFYKV